MPVTIDVPTGTITVTLANSIQEDFLSSVMPDLVKTLRDAVSNDSIEIKTHIEAEAVEKKAYTDREKFEEMAKINPVLRDLQEKWGLDTEF